MSSTLPPDLDGLDYVQPLGSGGYADVFLYEQQMPRMKVAVKVLKTEGLTPAIKQQFIDEANTMAQLADHPYIVQVFRAGTSEDARPYLMMKYYPPPNLAQRARSARFSLEEVLRTGIQLSSAVETAHRAGVIHRDIKPANVLVSQYGSPGLTDFGIAGRGGALEELDDDIGVSIPWAPPEVLFGQSNGDARADVYSLSATLWQLLVGRSPFEVPGGDNSAYALMPRIRSNPPPGTGRADVPQSMERLLAQAMSKNPLARPASAIEFARSLQQIEQDERFSRTAIVVLDELGHSGDSGSFPGRTQDRTQLRASSGSGPSARSGPRPTTGAPPPPLGQPVIGGGLSGGRSIGGAAPVPIADDVASRPRPAPGASGSGGSGPRPVPGPPPPQRSGQHSGPVPPGAFPPGGPSSSGPRPAPAKQPGPRLWWVAGGIAVVLLLVAIIGTTIALTGDEGGSTASSTTGDGGGGGGGGAVTGQPSIEVTADGELLVFTLTHDDFGGDDVYSIKTAPTRDNFGPATAVTVSEVKDGTGTYTLPVRSGTQGCGQAQVVRDHGTPEAQRSEWSEIVCATGKEAS